MSGFCFKVENTVKAELKTKLKPSDDEIDDFLSGSGLDLTKVMGFYRSSKEDGFFIKFDEGNADLHQYTKLLNSSNGIKINGQTHKVITSIIGEIITNFQIHNLPFEISDDILREELQNYGTVQEIIWQKHKSRRGHEIFNGVRNVHMQLQRPVPTTLNVMDIDARITHKYQDRICDQCMAITHGNNECIAKMDEIVPQVIISNATRQNSESGSNVLLERRRSSVKHENRVFMVGDIIKYVAVKI